MGARWPAPGQPIRHGAGAAPNLEIGDRAGACRNSRTSGLCRGSPIGLLNRWRWGEKALPRFIDKNATLALPDGAPLPPEWPVPQLVVPAEEISRWRQATGLGTAPAVALAPGSVGASKRWTYYAEAARLLAQQGLDVWVVGGPGEKALAAEIVASGGPRVRDLIGTDLRNGILAIAAASAAIPTIPG